MNIHIPIRKNNIGEEYLEMPYLEAKVNASCQAVIYQWKGYINDEAAMTGMKLVLEMVKRSQAVNLFADLTAFAGGSVEIAKWVDKVWSVQLREAGIKNLAILVPISTTGELTNHVALGATAATILNVKTFSKVKDVFAWFDSLKQ